MAFLVTDSWTLLKAFAFYLMASVADSIVAPLMPSFWTCSMTMALTLRNFNPMTTKDNPNSPQARLRHHVTGAIERGEVEAITEITEVLAAGASSIAKNLAAKAAQS